MQRMSADPPCSETAAGGLSGSFGIQGRLLGRLTPAAMSLVSKLSSFWATACRGRAVPARTLAGVAVIATVMSAACLCRAEEPASSTPVLTLNEAIQTAIAQNR